jgi:hypothetical protein
VKASWGRVAGILALTTLLVSSTGDGPAVRAQQGGPADPNPILELMPALRTSPAPPWLKQGVRLTYYSAAASLRGGRHRYVPDPDNPNCRFRDEQGNCFKQEDLGGGGPMGAGSGAGYMQANIVALDDSVAAMEIRQYALLNPTGPSFASFFGGAVGLPGAGGDLWLNPEVLRGTVGRSFPGLKILQMPYVLNGVRYDTVRIQAEASVWIYEARTGVLLLSNNSTKGPPIQGPLLPTDSREGMTMLTETVFVQARVPNVPWAVEPAPEWVGRYSFFKYEGIGTLFVPGSPPLSANVATTLRRLYAGNNWVRYEQTQMQGGQIGQNIRVVGSGQFGGLWVSPNALGRLRSGQTLDVDPVTRVTVFVSQIARRVEGGESITISEINDAHRLDSTYDRATGILIAVNQVNNVMHTEIRLQLTHLQ